MEVIEAVRTDRILSLKGKVLEPVVEGGVRDSFAARRIRVFDHPRRMRTTTEKPAWYLPANFNQGGYDLVHVEAEEKKKKTLHFTFFQVTRSARHTRKYKYMTEFINPFLGVDWNAGVGQAVGSSGGVLAKLAGGPTQITVKLIALVRDPSAFRFEVADGRLVPAPEVLAMQFDFDSPPSVRSGARSSRHHRTVDSEEEEEEEEVETEEDAEEPKSKKAKGRGKREASARGRNRRGGK